MMRAVYEPTILQPTIPSAPTFPEGLAGDTVLERPPGTIIYQLRQTPRPAKIEVVSQQPTQLLKILESGYDAFEQTHALPDYVRRAVRMTRYCRTAALGGHIECCPEGHFGRICYNSCGHRFCPRCASRKQQLWIVKQQAKLLPVRHFHATFTIPHAFNALWLANPKQMATLLCRAAWQATRDLLTDPQRLGGLPGMIAALHTWDAQLLFHPHVHCLVTGGGLSPDGAWRASRPNFLVHVRPLMQRFRHRLCRAVERELRKHTLAVPEGERLQTLLNTIHRVNRTEWEVFIAKSPDAGGPSSDEVLRYQAKAVAGGPISDVRLAPQLRYITEVAGADSRLHDSTRSEVTIRYGAYNPDTQRRERNQVLTLSMDEFLQRLLLHVPPPSTQTVRSYGLYAGAKTDALEQSRRLLPSASPIPPAPSESTTESSKERSMEDSAAQRAQCPVCGKALVMTRRLPSSMTGKLPQRPSTQVCRRGG
jgi:hypothetical protein